MEELKKVETVEMPCGHCCGYCCGDCVFMDLNSMNKYDEAWCGQYQKYYHPSESASSCSHFRER